MTHDIFISHSAKDKTTADAVCARLEAAGIKCWIAPRDVLPGLDWSEAIVNAITNCRAMVLIFSSSANTSRQIKREVERAVHKGKVIIPFRIEDVEPSGALEYFISTPHWLDALTPPMEKHISRLAGTIRSLLNGFEDVSVDQESILSHRESRLASSLQKMPRSIPWTLVLTMSFTVTVLAIMAFFLVGGQEDRAAERIVVLPLEGVKYTPPEATGDSWAEIITEARRLRALGKTSEALAAFSKYEDLFGEKYPSTKRYVRTAQLFTLQCDALGLEGGAYIWECLPEGAGSKAGLAVGDIITGYGGYSVRSTKSYIESKKKMRNAKKVKIEYLRLDDAGHFQKKANMLDYGVLGIRLMDI